ncbi:MAG TPA: hypothetical protein VJA94_13510 [Candidatus Angelobacter sp.]
MKKVLLASVLLAATFAVAGDKSYQTGSLKEMTSVECGVDQKSGTSFVGDLLGTDNGHSQARKTFCAEYVLETARTVYHIRPREQKNPVLLPVGQTAEFRMKKDRMVLRVPEGDNKEREYDVVSMSPVQNNSAVAAKK